MKLENNEIHLHCVRPDQLTDPDLLERCETLLADDERRQMSRLYFPHHRHQFLVTRALVRTCLSLYHDVEPADWVFERNAYDKPRVAGPVHRDAVNFNLSHADGMIAVGFARQYDIGVDVEDTGRNTQAALNRLSSYFSADEILMLEGLDETRQKQRFFDIWTLKESYIKARGGGLSIPLRKFSFDFLQDSLSGFSIDTSLEDHAENWQFWQMSMPPAYRLAVAVNSAERALELKLFDSAPLAEPEPRTLPPLSRYPVCP